MNVCEAHSWCCFSLLLIHAEGSVLLLRRNLVKENKGVWRRRIYRKYASCRWLKNAGLEFTRADVVLSISRGPPGQWFPEIEYWASAIFVGTSGIPPKITYRSVKSYRFILKYWYLSCGLYSHYYTLIPSFSLVLEFYYSYSFFISHYTIYIQDVIQKYQD